ncbi:hypothetical protein [Herbidospora sp. RD11066]
MGRKTPQEQDRRNNYGEIPHRANRHHDHQLLEGALGTERPKRWRKCPDAPLGEIVPRL